MEGECGAETRRWKPTAVVVACHHDLTRSNSDASSLTAENCRDIFRSTAKVTPWLYVINRMRSSILCFDRNFLQDCRTIWTDEKHNSYIHHLEMSFVKQLHQSKSLLAHCSEQNHRYVNVPRKRLINVKNASEQNECWQKINFVRGEPLLSSTPANSHASLKSKSMNNFKNTSIHSHPTSAKMLALVELFSTRKHGEGKISHGMPTCSHGFSPSEPCGGDSIDLTREGMGQNFLDDGNRSTSNFNSQLKRSKKMALGDGSHQDQIVPHGTCPTTDYSVINSSTRWDRTSSL